MEGSGTCLPLDLHRIAARCKNSYYAPSKFSAVQLAYLEPRCRVLVFRKLSPPQSYIAPLHTWHARTDTGRLVGTGCSNAMEARLALMRAQRQLYEDADVHIHVRNFDVRSYLACTLLVHSIVRPPFPARSAT